MISHQVGARKSPFGLQQHQLYILFLDCRLEMGFKVCQPAVFAVWTGKVVVSILSTPTSGKRKAIPIALVRSATLS